MPFLRRLIFVLLNACMIVIGSEMLFWARPLDSLTWPGIILTIIVYSWIVALFLATITYFRVSSFATLFLAGALFGWLDEGVLVQTLYAQLPISIAYTGLAWHALLVICALWFGLQQRLLSRAPWRLVRWGLVMGVGWGLWAVTWWTEPGLAPTSIATFATYAFATISLFGGAAWLASRIAPRPFAPSRIEIILLIGAIVIFFAVVTLPSAPLAIVILPLLLAPIFVALRRHRDMATQPDILTRMAAAGPIPVRHLPILWLIPLAATLVYASFSVAHLVVPTSIFFLVITAPLGFGLYIWSLVRVMMTHPPRTALAIAADDRKPDEPTEFIAAQAQS